MSDEKLVSYTMDEIKEMIARGEGQTNWARLSAMTEEELEQAIADDPDAQWDVSTERRVLTQAQLVNWLEVSPDVVRWFSGAGPDYKDRMNDVLRAYVDAHQTDMARRAS